MISEARNGAGSVVAGSLLAVNSLLAGDGASAHLLCAEASWRSVRIPRTPSDLQQERRYCVACRQLLATPTVVFPDVDLSAACNSSGPPSCNGSLIHFAWLKVGGMRAGFLLFSLIACLFTLTYWIGVCSNFGAHLTDQACPLLAYYDARTASNKPC